MRGKQDAEGRSRDSIARTIHYALSTILRGFRPTSFGRLRPVLSSVRKGALTLRDVKNEDRTDYVYENTENDDKMSRKKNGFLRKMHQMSLKETKSVGLFGRKFTHYARLADNRMELTIAILCASR